MRSNIKLICNLIRINVYNTKSSKIVSSILLWSVLIGVFNWIYLYNEGSSLTLYSMYMNIFIWPRYSGDLLHGIIWIMQLLILVFYIGVNLEEELTKKNEYIFIRMTNRAYWLLAKIIYAMLICFIFVILTLLTIGFTESIIILLNNLVSENHIDLLLSKSEILLLLKVSEVYFWGSFALVTMELIIIIFYRSSRISFVLISVLLVCTWYLEQINIFKWLPSGLLIINRYEFINAAEYSYTTGICIYYSIITILICSIIGSLYINKTDLIGEIIQR